MSEQDAPRRHPGEYVWAVAVFAALGHVYVLYGPDDWTLRNVDDRWAWALWVVAWVIVWQSVMHRPQQLWAREGWSPRVLGWVALYVGLLAVASYGLIRIVQLS